MAKGRKEKEPPPKPPGTVSQQSFMVYRSTQTGRFVSRKDARLNPKTSYEQTVKSGNKKK